MKPELAQGMKALLARRERLDEVRGQALGRVGRMVERHQELSTELHGELAALSHSDDELDALKKDDGSALTALLRRFGRRNVALERRSAAQELLRRYEAVNRRLREASSFNDELRLCAVELDTEVQALHRDRANALEAEREAGQRVLELERQLDALEGVPEEQAQLDSITFQLRKVALDLELHRAAEGLFEQHLEPARSLRDTVMSLHEEMSHFLLSASSTVDGAGRRIQALGMAADAPAVVMELQDSLHALGEAMQVTETYVEQTRHLLGEVLPKMSAQLQDRGAVEALLTVGEATELDRDRARALAERALRQAAVEEIDAFLTDGEKTL